MYFSRIARFDFVSQFLLFNIMKEGLKVVDITASNEIVYFENVVVFMLSKIHNELHEIFHFPLNRAVLFDTISKADTKIILSNNNRNTDTKTE